MKWIRVCRYKWIAAHVFVCVCIRRKWLVLRRLIAAHLVKFQRSIAFRSRLSMVFEQFGPFDFTEEIFNRKLLKVSSEEDEKKLTLRLVAFAISVTISQRKRMSTVSTLFTLTSGKSINVHRMCSHMQRCRHVNIYDDKNVCNPPLLLLSLSPFLCCCCLHRQRRHRQVKSNC